MEIKVNKILFDGEEFPAEVFNVAPSPDDAELHQLLDMAASLEEDARAEIVTSTTSSAF